MKKISPKAFNCSRRKRASKIIKFVIFHYTGMQSEIDSLNRLTDPKSKVSAHYLINRKGKVFRLVNENYEAWHAGKSMWKNHVNLNKNSIGIELVNIGHEFGYQNFPKKQILSLINLCRRIKKKYKIKKENFLGHSDIAPLRKQDPGEKFPWEKLSKYGIGQWFEKKRIKSISMNKIDKKIFFKNIFKLGYRYFDLSIRKPNDRLIIQAFQRRFNSKKINGKIDKKTFKISNFLSR